MTAPGAIINTGSCRLNSPQGWGISCEFADLFGPVAEPLRPYLPSFRHALVDLTQIDDQRLSSEVRLQAFLKALKYSRRPGFPNQLYAELTIASALDESDLLAILTYFNRGSIKVDRNIMNETVPQFFSPEEQEKTKRWLFKMYLENLKAEGEGKILILLLEKRFGALPQAVRERISSADTTTLETWAGRALDGAPDLESVLTAPPDETAVANGESC